MKIIDKVKVIGRGYVFIIIPDDTINMTDTIVFNGVQFKITGIERLSFMKQVGLILNPNDTAGNIINIGDEIEIYENKI